MAESNATTGSVKWVGTPGVECAEALGYTVTDTDGNTYGEGLEADNLPTSILYPDYVISGIPEDEISRFLRNSGFEPNDSAAENAKANLQAFTAARVNGSELSEFDVHQLRAKEAARAERGEAELSEEAREEIEARYSVEGQVDAETEQRAKEEEALQEQRRNRRRANQQTQETSETNGEEGEGA